MEQLILLHEKAQITDQSTERIFEKIDQIEQSLCKLKAETSNLQRIKNQCQIYLQMYQNDYESLKSLYKNLKDQMNATPPNIQEYQNPPSQIVPDNNNIPSKEQQIEQNSMPVDAMVISPTSGNALSHVELPWDIKSNDPFYNKSTVKLCYTLNTSSVLCSVQFDSTGKRFAFADGRTVFLINTADGSLIASFDIPHTLSQTEIHTRSLCFSPDDRYILISATNNSIIVFSIQTRQVAAQLKEHHGLVSSLLFLPDTNQLLSGGFDGALCLWDMNTMSLVKKIQHGSPEEGGQRAKDDMVIALAMSYDRSFIAVGFMNGSVGIYEPSFTQPMNTFNAHAEYMLNVVTANRSLMIATSSHDKTIKVWSLRGVASCRQTLTGHTNCVLTACFSPDDSILFSGSKDETIKAWDHKKGELIFTLTAHKNTLFEIDHHPTEKYVVTCSGDGIVCLWQYATKQ
ncbi:Transcriptional repressor tup12-related protein [Tritrichomonas foetus]|uniref:Transcriptional repressor tup12-related protein n=1 Tax=Tritrichomonas foetus TaxID=1144522 RepID=A0A1J4KW66_9EUKA|nr:Transcriptional repressor tup12-related protein [Tritrichomonas foetus]|eukprot:OHT13757.1 Transcriptional repressor tup12-related protein [Tritrichomonas foetus]